MLCPNGTVKPFLVSLVEPVAYLKSELVRHLDKVRDSVAEVDRIVSSHRYPDNKRTVMVVGLLDTIIEYHHGVLQLIESGSVGPSYSLVRDMVRGMRYGLWISSCATEEQILQIEKSDEFPVSILEMVREIETTYNADSFFENLKDRWGSQLYKYSRSSIVQLGRWDIDSTSGLHFDDDEIGDVTTIATLCIVLLAAKFLANQKQPADCKQIEALAADYPNRSS
jgi:hypothetical protein